MEGLSEGLQKDTNAALQNTLLGKINNVSELLSKTILKEHQEISVRNKTGGQCKKKKCEMGIFLSISLCVHTLQFRLEAVCSPLNIVCMLGGKKGAKCLLISYKCSWTALNQLNDFAMTSLLLCLALKKRSNAVISVSQIFF